MRHLMGFGVKSFLQLAILTGFTTVLMGFGSCTQTTQTICSQKLPGFQKALHSALSDIPGWAGRQPAAAADGSQTWAQDWPTWAEQNLKEVQYWMDTVQDHDGLRIQYERLGSIANELVNFHGYSTREDRARMRQSLEKIRKDADQISRDLCSVR